MEPITLFSPCPCDSVSGLIDRASRGVLRLVIKLQARRSAHDLRHGFALWLCEATHDTYQVERVLGHAMVAITETCLRSLGLEVRDYQPPPSPALTSSPTLLGPSGPLYSVWQCLGVMEGKSVNAPSKSYLPGRSGSGTIGDGPQSSGLILVAYARSSVSICCQGPSRNFAQSAIDCQTVVVRTCAEAMKPR